MTERTEIKTLVASVRTLLWAQWDPLNLAGIAPDDEYDAYALPLAGMVWHGRSASEIADYLDRACVEYLGVLADRSSHEGLAAALLALREAR